MPEITTSGKTETSTEKYTPKRSLWSRIKPIASKAGHYTAVGVGAAYTAYKNRPKSSSASHVSSYRRPKPKRLTRRTSKPKFYFRPKKPRRSALVSRFLGSG